LFQVRHMLSFTEIDIRARSKVMILQRLYFREVYEIEQVFDAFLRMYQETNIP
jgi:hypothetical protein